MSTVTPGVENSTDGDAQTANESDTIEIPIEEYERLAKLDDLIEVKADPIEEATLEDIWIAGNPLGKIVSNTDGRSRKNRKRIEEGGSPDATPGGNTGETTTQNADSTEITELTGIEKLAACDDDDEYPFVGGKPGPSVNRALSIYEHFREWSGRKVMAGWTITENLRKLLSTAMEERLEWKQVYRACRKLEEWSQGEIQFEKSDRHGWMLVTDNKRIVHRQASSANGG